MTKKWFKIMMNILAVLYMIMGWIIMSSNRWNEVIFLIEHGWYGIGMFVFGGIVVYITFITHVPKFCLKLLHDYIKKVINE